MKAKLIKSTGNHYDLRTNGELIASTYQWVSPDKWLQLSRQNCNSLFGIVDVEKLANEYVSNFKDYNGTSDVDFMVGFLKAMELNKDKLFTVEDLDNFRKFQIQEQNFSKSCLDVWLKSLQQPTEIDVEIVMEEKSYSYLVTIGEVKTTRLEPKLDSEGCLILKNK